MSRAFRTLSLASLMVLVFTFAAQANGLTPIATTNADEWGGMAGAPGTVWNMDTRRDAWIQVSGGGRLNPTNTLAWAGGIDGNVLTYQLVTRKKGSEVARYDLALDKKVAAPSGVNSKFWEYAPGSSGDWVLFGRTNVDFGMRREWRKIMLVNTSTHKAKMLMKTPGSAYLYPGQINGNWATWDKCGKRSCSVYLYDIGSKTVQKIPNAARYQFNAGVAADGTVYFVREAAGCTDTQIVRRAPGGGSEAVIYQFATGTDSGDLYVYTDSTPQQNLYLDEIDCTSKNFRSDVYEFPAADTAPAIVRPVPLSPAGPAASRPPLAARGAQPRGA